METGMEVKKRGRGRPRKRRLEEDENDKVDKKLCTAIIKQALDIRWRPLVGRYVLKEFEDTGVFLGKVVCYDSGLYRVDYEDGDCEDLESKELRQILLSDEYFDDELNTRRTKLDELVLQKSAKKNNDVEKKVVGFKNAMDSVETSGLSELTGELVVESDGPEGEGDIDSSSDSCEYVRHRDLGLEVEAPVVPPPELPPSSGTVGVSEEYVSHLFSVYSFLRSFNICLFLSPFTLDDLVGAINCGVQNTLLDAIHVALLRALKRHLEILSADGSELASKCLRCIDWSLLDSLTWPVYLVFYFTIMGYVNGHQWKGFYDDFLKREYYTLPVGRKLMILQILCDDVLESAELRAEIDMREESEFGIDPDALTINFSENGPRMVHPRYSKTLACKDREVMEIIAESHGTKSSVSSKYLGAKGTVGDVDALDEVDRNGDECRLCGMDGTLLCCDGCPSAYHSRCIGVFKMYIPEGPWFCPECTINKLGPTITKGTSLKGAEMFGIDLYEQVFLGTCNHLLVLRTSFSREICLRYYNQNDIPKILHALSATVQHRSLYCRISYAIAQYWHIPQSAFTPLELIERGLNLELATEDKRVVALSLSSPGQENHKVPENIESENVISLNRSNVEEGVGSCLDTFVDATAQSDTYCNMSNGDATRMENIHIMSMCLPGQIKMESSGSVNRQTDLSDINHQIMADKSSAEFVTCTSANSDGSHVGQMNGTLLPATVLYQSKEINHADSGIVERNSESDFLYVGRLFKPYAYINHYMHGDFAASAASNLAILSSEESRVSEAQKSGNAKKNISDISLQLKAFSTTASRFFWPSSEKKLIEVPRERCGWCHSCKLASNSRRGCMLNSAVIAATKGAMKIISGLRPTMNGEGNLPSIATYILYMGVVLFGLTVGPFLSASYRKHWRNRVENASTCNAMREPLLDLEKHLRIIALSGDWVKSMDDLFVESGLIQSSASTIGTAQKRGPSGKRQRKQFGMGDVTADSYDDRNFFWWRGVKPFKLVFHNAILPPSLVKRAARQGGSKKIFGIDYADDTEVSKRSKQLAWRAAVECSKNVSQLALQVRYLDHHVRWNDMVRPEQNFQDGKGVETEASVFRNATICDKKIEKNRVNYGVDFGRQKHLPSRVMKNIVELEQGDDGNDKYWFSETYVPLYLIKEYEERLDEVVLPMVKKSLSELSNLQRRQLKASRRDIFSYLVCKRDKLDKCFCASCHHDVFLRNAVKCSACEGYCHKDCTVSSTNYASEEVEFLITCNRCYLARSSETTNESPATPLPLQRQECHSAVTVTKSLKIKLHGHPLTSMQARENRLEMKQASASSLVSKSRTKCNWGVIWKRKNAEDTGTDFRRRNILLRGSSERNWLLRPVCNLCQKEYDCDQMYIHCETCNKWFHADAVELDESKLLDVVGFKCCRCRRIKPPVCPYQDSQARDKPQSLKSGCKKSFKPGKREVDSDSVTIADSMMYEPTTPVYHTEETFVQDDDPLLFTLSRVEQVAEQKPVVDSEWNIGGQGPQKLPVRRHTKQHQGDTEGVFANNYCHTDSEIPLLAAESPVPLETTESALPLDANNLMNPSDMSYGAEWDVSANSIEGEMLFDYDDLNGEDMEFEPQTYFSFTELLASDDGGQFDECDASGNVVGSSINQTDVVSLDGVSEQYAAAALSDRIESMPSLQPNINSKLCKMCSCSEPVPDLSCEICCLVIHRGCSPWVESSSLEHGWRCGHCREWR